ncbi:MAG: AMP-binding protein, partial [Chloroflexota bacterium]|nr:AMP-binding protein [Chloroflexota bacterium]
MDVRRALEGFVPFPPDVAQRYRERGYWEDRPLIDHFREAFVRFQGRTAIVAGAERVSYGRLAERVDRLALHLLALGLRPLDRLVLQLPNIPEFIYLYFACQRIGVIPLMALPPYREHEIGHFVDFVDAVAYAIPDSWGGFRFPDLAMAVRAKAASLRHILVTGDDVPEGSVSISSLLGSQPALEAAELDGIRINPTEPCCFQLSGGTTAMPKVIARTHNDYTYHSKATAALANVRPGDAFLAVLPVAHNFPLATPGIQGFLLQGGRIVLSTSPRAAEALPLIEREGITHLELVPAILIRWLDDPDLAAHDLSSVRVVNSGGQRLQPETKRRAEAAFPRAKVQEVFGMAEGLLMCNRL